MKKKNLTFSVWIVSLIFILFSCQTPETKIYVSPDGNDSSNGDLNKPIATLGHAAELARLDAGRVPVTIFLSGGTYTLINPLKLGVKDGGTKEAPVIWQAVNGEKPVISGGIPVGNWKRDTNGLWVANLPVDIQKKFRSFYVNNKRMNRARFPDKGFLKVSKAGKDNRTNFFFKKGEIPKVKSSKNLELVFLHDWSITRIRVDTINWKKEHLIAVDSIGARLPFFKLDNWGKHPRYYLENAKEFCDSPGEWYCDFNNRKIYYYPYPNDNIDKTEGIIPLANKLITMQGSPSKSLEYVNFKGITFEYTNWQIPEKGYCGVQACMYDDRGISKTGWNKIPAAIEMDLTNNSEFTDCTIRHTGGSGIWIREYCKKNKISNSHIYDISGNGINIGEGRDRLVKGKPWWESVPEQVSIYNEISNSTIEDCGKQFYGAIGIWGGLVANTMIEHNEIRNLPYTGISIGWMWNPISTPCRENTINANHIHHIMNKLSDGGGIYCLGLQPDSKITNNLIHDVTINAGRAESNGMFFDEGIKDLLVENNIVYNIARSPLRFHKAYENIVRQNILVCGEGIPPIRYNNTKEDDIKKIDNMILSQSSKSDMEKLYSIIDKRKKDIGLNR